YLHPRSRTTGTLFTTTLAISFIVVGLPHVLPCPVDRRPYADSAQEPQSEAGRRRRRREQQPTGQGDQIATRTERPKRECPVPKPSGLIGQVMGF
ncbi:hypothetical protein K470DRAFT_194752, partial [Piedraia hortae CBS 480.64]